MDGKLLYERILDALRDCEDEGERNAQLDTIQRLELLLRTQNQWDKYTNWLLK